MHGDRDAQGMRHLRADQREWAHLAQQIRAEAEQLRAPLANWRIDERVLDAMSRVPREAFVQNNQRYRAYANRPAPIGFGQTISQPFIVALMTDLLNIGARDTVLEVGTGSGYQAAVLAELVDWVYSTEIVEPLAVQARARLIELGYHNVEVRASNGSDGWPGHPAFDGIIVTAAAPFIPPALLEQLRPGARLLIPVGDEAGLQWLTVVEKSADGRIDERRVLAVRFVPLTSNATP